MPSFEYRTRPRKVEAYRVGDNHKPDWIIEVKEPDPEMYSQMLSVTLTNGESLAVKRREEYIVKDGSQYLVLTSSEFAELCENIRYRCIKDFSVGLTDDDGFWTGEERFFNKGDIFILESGDVIPDYLTDGVCLTSVDDFSIEVERPWFEEHFEEI